MTDHRIPDIEDALDTLLDAILSLEKAETDPTQFKINSASELIDSDPNDLELQAITENPIFHAYRAAIRKLGKHLFRITGSTDTMRDIAERVANRDPANYGKRAVIMDHRWDKIGNDTDRWIT